MIFNKLYNLKNQTAQPGTVENIKHRFHHNKVSSGILLDEPSLFENGVPI